VVHAWGSVMGAAIARRTGKIYVQDRKLFLQITSPSLANELMLSKSRIVEMLNEEVNANVIDDVIFM
jgi:Dna[CI] antecedent, DciA